jgi:predicted DNA-binding protein
MNAMKTFLLRIPISMNEELDAIASEIFCSKSQFIRQSISRNLDICRNVEGPAIRAFYKQRIPKLF